MITINSPSSKGKKGIIYYKDDVIGVCDNAETFLDILCQIKEEKSNDYRMEVEVEVGDKSKRTYVYRFTNDGRIIPSSYPGVALWTDDINKRLLYLYNFSINCDFKL